MKRKGLIVAALLLIGLGGITVWRFLAPAGQGPGESGREPAGKYVGSAGCRGCHERFFELWAPSRHGLAMQPVTGEFTRDRITPHAEEIRIGDTAYQVWLDPEGGRVRARGPEGEKDYPLSHALGGKNVYYFLTPWERGRLQVLPLAFDVRQQEWFDTTASMVRHLVEPSDDEPLDWRERPLTFNTSCYNCHVSQLSTNYDLKTDTYRTVWTEPGINCETCHGPGAEHVRVCREASEGAVPEDLEIILTRDFNTQQSIDMCAPCHAKMAPLTPYFRPGERYFDHFNLHTLENLDFYPDGRDLGENFTFTLWRISPCVGDGDLDCIHCHTSSGRNRHTGDRADEACLPCHEALVEDPAAHSHHAADSSGSRCVGCHMPRTVFARMQRHDHSMLPPTPAATLAFESPNACNLCHTDRDAAWSDQWVRRWYGRDYQAPLLHRAQLIDAARKRDWSRLPEMLRYLESESRNEVFTTSLIRLLEFCEKESKWPVLIQLMEDPSPLVRSAAAAALAANQTGDARQVLLAATEDEYRLVRIQAATALSVYPAGLFGPENQQRLERATRELEESLSSRPDDWTSHYNLGNHQTNRGNLREALKSYQTALRLQPDAVLPLVNASIVHARLGEATAAEAKLKRALEIEPGAAAANFNLGLLKAEQGDAVEAEKYLRAALEADPMMAAAAYNLGVLISGKRPSEALQWCRKAAELRPEEPKYAYTLAFYLRQTGDLGGAVRALERLLAKHPTFADGYDLAATILVEEGRIKEAQSVYRRALEQGGLAPAQRLGIEARLQQLQRPR